MVTDFACAFADKTGIDQFDRCGYCGVQPLLAQGRDGGKEGLTDQFMGKGKRLLGSFGAGDHYSHLLRFLDNSEEIVNVDFTDLGQKPKAETPADHRGGCQDPLFIFVEPFQTSADDHAHVFRNVDLIDPDVAAEPASRVEDLSFFRQMPIDLLDEEWIALALFEDEVHESFWSLCVAERPQHLRDGLPRKTAELQRTITHSNQLFQSSEQRR